MSARRRLRGFSMMEVMVASALLAITGALLYTSLTSSIDAKEMVEQTSDRFHLARQALSRMTDEVSMAYLSAHHSQQDPRTKTRFVGERNALAFTAFGYVSRREDSKAGASRELSYELAPDADSGVMSIIRREQVGLDDDVEEGGRERTLLPGATELTFEYWDTPSESWKEEWDTEESATLNRLPERVRITFVATMDDDQNSEQRFMTQSRIWLTTPIRFEN
ncbi:MAG: type II secretion system protein GspJ [Myxococcota bacterium]